MNVLHYVRMALFLVPGLLLAQTWTYNPPAYPAVCTNPAVVGEWTMDYAAATNRALAEGKNLYLLVTGSTWCPDCDGLQRQVMATPEMKAFMEGSDAYWVWLDLPSRRATNAVHYGWLCHTNTGLYTLEQSEAILARNRRLEFIYGSIKNYRSPGTINMPTLIVCRPDGTYQGEAAHYRQWTNVTAEIFINKIRRIWNDDAWDVQDNLVPGKSDDTVQSATPLAEIGETVTRQSHTLSPTDSADWYVFNAQPGKTYSFSAEGRLLNGQAALPTGWVTVELFTQTNATALPVAAVSGRLGEGQAVSWMLNQTLPITGYVKVSGTFTKVAGYAFAYNRFTAAPSPDTNTNQVPQTISIKGAEGAVIDVSDSSRMTGVLTFSVTKSGLLTAKYRTMKRTVVFSTRNFWSSFDKYGVLTAVITKGNYTLEIQMPGMDELYARVIDPEYANPLSARLFISPWSTLNEATAYEGYYTVVLASEAVSGKLAPTGYSYMTILLKAKSAKTGTATYAGKLADGTAFSGSSVLQPLNDGTAQLIVFARNGKHKLAGLLSITADAESARWANPRMVSACRGVVPYWTHDTGYDATSFDMTLDVFGGYYSNEDSLLEFYEMYSGKGAMYLTASGNVPESGTYGVATELPLLPLAVTDSSLAIPMGTDNPTRARMSFTKRTGFFRGSLRIPFATSGGKSKNVSAQFAGVLLPGWVGGERCDLGCGPVDEDLPSKPFGMGTYWFKDFLTVETGNGNVMVPFNAGYPLIIEKAAE